MNRISEFLGGVSGLDPKIVATDPTLQRGRAWCHTCGHSQRVDSADCLRHGWPTHCNATMSIDSPEERNRIDRTGSER